MVSLRINAKGNSWISHSFDGFRIYWHLWLRINQAPRLVEALGPPTLRYWGNHPISITEAQRSLLTSWRPCSGSGNLEAAVLYKVAAAEIHLSLVARDLLSRKSVWPAGLWIAGKLHWNQWESTKIDRDKPPRSSIPLIEWKTEPPEDPEISPRKFRN